MALNGRLLACAREAQSKIRLQNEQEHRRRQAEVYARVPEIRLMERQLQDLVKQAIGAAMDHGTDPVAAVRELRDESLRIQGEIAEQLVSHGWPPEYLDDIYSCRKCRDTGFVNGAICSCLKALYDRELARDLSDLIRLGSERFENFNLDYYGGEREYMEKILRLCERCAYSFGKDTPNLLFTGGPGLGKTYLSACMARVIAGLGFSVVYETAVGAFDCFEQAKFGKFEDTEAAEATKKRILSCDLLILDDLGTEMTTTFTQSALYTIINTRLLEEKKTIISTNLTERDLSARYTQQIVSRILGEYIKLSFVGQDIRRLKKST